MRVGSETDIPRSVCGAWRRIGRHPTVIRVGGRAAIAATICVPWPKGSRLPTARSASCDPKAILLRTLAAISGVKSATGGVRSSVLNWRRECPPINRILLNENNYVVPYDHFSPHLYPHQRQSLEVRSGAPRTPPQDVTLSQQREFRMTVNSGVRTAQSGPEPVLAGGERRPHSG
jgi:hypothetical protein